MKIVKQMLRHLGTLYKKLILVVHIVTYLFYTWNPNLCLLRLKPLRPLNSLFLTKLGLVSLIARTPQNCSNVLTTPNCPWSNFANILAHILWQRQHDLEFELSIISFWGICPQLSQHCRGNNSQGIFPPTCQLSIDTHLASTSPSTFTESVGMYTKRWISAMG